MTYSGYDEIVLMLSYLEILTEADIKPSAFPFEWFMEYVVGGE